MSVWIKEKRSSDIPAEEPMVCNFLKSVHLNEVVLHLASQIHGEWLIEDDVVLKRELDKLTVAPVHVVWRGHEPEMLFDPERAVGGLYLENELDEVDVAALRQLVLEARRRRRSSFRKCSDCGQLTPPDRRVDSLCHACFEKSGGAF